MRRSGSEWKGEERGDMVGREISLYVDLYFKILARVCMRVCVCDLRAKDETLVRKRNHLQLKGGMASRCEQATQAHR